MKNLANEKAMEEARIERLDDLGFTPEDFEEACKEHIGMDGPCVYCGTYHKYNNGSIDGGWIEISTFYDYEDFINFCNAIHSDEDGPELMFQDYQGFPNSWYSESCMGEDTFYKILEYAELCENHDQAAVDAFIDDLGRDLSSFEDSYEGKFNSEEDFAYKVVDECYDLEKIMGDLSSYFDYEAFARDLFMTDYDFVDGYVFRAY